MYIFFFSFFPKIAQHTPACISEVKSILYLFIYFLLQNLIFSKSRIPFLGITQCNIKNLEWMNLITKKKMEKDRQVHKLDINEKISAN